MLVCAMLMAKWTRVGAAGLLAERMRVEGVGLPAVGSVIIEARGLVHLFLLVEPQVLFLLSVYAARELAGGDEIGSLIVRGRLVWDGPRLSTG